MRSAETSRAGNMLAACVLLLGCLGAIADGAGQPEQAASHAVSPAPSSASTVGLAAPAASDGSLDSARELVRLLQRRKEELDQREEVVRLAESRMAVLKSEVEGLLTRYEQKYKAGELARQTEAQRRAKEAAEARKANIIQMAKIYEAMAAEEAAARIEKLPSATALELLRAMKGKAAAAVLAQVNPAKAAAFSERLLATP